MLSAGCDSTKVVAKRKLFLVHDLRSCLPLGNPQTNAKGARERLSNVFDRQFALLAQVGDDFVGQLLGRLLGRVEH